MVSVAAISCPFLPPILLAQLVWRSSGKTRELGVLHFRRIERLALVQFREPEGEVVRRAAEALIPDDLPGVVVLHETQQRPKAPVLCVLLCNACGRPVYVCECIEILRSEPEDERGFPQEPSLPLDEMHVAVRLVGWAEL